MVRIGLVLAAGRESLPASRCQIQDNKMKYKINQLRNAKKVNTQTARYGSGKNTNRQLFGEVMAKHCYNVGFLDQLQIKY